MRFRVALFTLVALTASIIFSSVPAWATARPHAHMAQAPTAHTVYVSGLFIDATGFPSTFASLASIMVDSSGAYSGTLTMAGTNPLTLTVTGSLSGTGMTLQGSMNGQALSVQARPIVDVVGDRGKTSPPTTAGNEFAGPLTLGASPSGYVTAIDTSIMREYSFAASISRGPDRGSAINAGLWTLMDRHGEIHGYLLRDDNGALFPIESGTVARGRMLLHVNLLANGQLIGVATESRSILANQLLYRGTFGGPRAGDEGTWLSAPPE